MNRTSRSKTRIALIRMPWDTVLNPSPAMGFLSTPLRENGYEVKVVYANYRLAKMVGLGRYEFIGSGVGWQMIPEWFFSKAAFPESFKKDSSAELLESWRETYTRDYIDSREGMDVESLARIREETAVEFCEELAEECKCFEAIGITCTINQLVATLAVTRAIRRKNPNVCITLGGAQVEGDMGDAVLELAPWIDAVYKGEGEPGVVGTFDWMTGLAEEPPEWVSYRKSDGSIHVAQKGCMVQDMDSLPIPDYSDYFNSLRGWRKSGLNVTPFAIPFVSARGCWWGEVQHCTFCGLNGEGMVFRKKSAKRILDEWQELTTRYHHLALVGVDNIIPHEYLKDVLPRVKESGVDYELYYETKSNLKRTDMEMYQQAGIRKVQPGVESLKRYNRKLWMVI